MIEPARHGYDGQIVFVDTPGIHRPLHRLNVRMVDAAVETLREMDVIALVFDASTKPGHGDDYVAKLLEYVTRPVVLVLNKIDLVPKSALLPLIAQAGRWHDFAAIVPVSAATGDGVDRLERVLLEQLPEGDPIFPDDYLTDQPERALAAEMVREKVLAHTRAELPFSTAVAIDEFDESEREQLLRIYCTIWVEQESQKPIVIGRGGDDDQAHRHRGAAGSRTVLRDEGVPGPPRQSECRLAEQRADARRARRAETDREAETKALGPYSGISGTFPPARLNAIVTASKGSRPVSAHAFRPG